MDKESRLSNCNQLEARKRLKALCTVSASSYLYCSNCLGVAAAAIFQRTGSDRYSFKTAFPQSMTGDSDVGSKCLTQDDKHYWLPNRPKPDGNPKHDMGILDGIDTADSEYLEGESDTRQDGLSASVPQGLPS